MNHKQPLASVYFVLLLMLITAAKAMVTAASFAFCEFMAKHRLLPHGAVVLTRPVYAGILPNPGRFHPDSTPFSRILDPLSPRWRTFAVHPDGCVVRTCRPRERPL